MDVAPVGGGRAAGEHAVPVAELHSLAESGGDDPLRAAVVQRHPVGVEHDAGDAGVAGDPPRLGGGEDRPEPGEKTSMNV